MNANSKCIKIQYLTIYSKKLLNDHCKALHCFFYFVYISIALRKYYMRTLNLKILHSKKL